MRILFLATLLFAASATASAPAMAQGTPAQRTEMLMQVMKDKLTLTADQETQIRAVLTASQEQAMKDRDAAAGDRTKMMTLAQERMQKTDAQISAVLTDEQRKKYEPLQAEMRRRSRERMMQRPNGQN